MALDFYHISDSKSILFKLTNFDADHIKEVLNEYRKLTGLRIDEYGTTRISQGHVELIVKLLNDHLSKRYLKPSEKERILQLITLFNQSQNGLIAVGD